MTIHIGVDPGVAVNSPGALVVVNDRHDVIVMFDMPVLKRGNRSFLSVPALAHHMKYLGDKFIPDSIVLEEPLLLRVTGKYAIASMFHGYGALEALLNPLGTVTRVRPAMWKKTMGLQGKDKEASRLMAQQMFPTFVENLLRKKDHNRAEALLMAEYGRRVAP